MGNLRKGEEYIIKSFPGGYAIVGHPYWWKGNEFEQLYQSYKTKQECIDAVISAGATYKLKNAHLMSKNVCRCI